mmetsp:Transcript_31954/g.93970  ORF Transcript_31954/g.93970 Transcript_31954/m.93970 type:complete len:258 (-) Transcript_31954:100-873(-)
MQRFHLSLEVGHSSIILEETGLHHTDGRTMHVDQTGNTRESPAAASSSSSTAVWRGGSADGRCPIRSPSGLSVGIGSGLEGTATVGRCGTPGGRGTRGIGRSLPVRRAVRRHPRDARGAIRAVRLPRHALHPGDAPLAGLEGHDEGEAGQGQEGFAQRIVRGADGIGDALEENLDVNFETFERHDWGGGGIVGGMIAVLFVLLLWLFGDSFFVLPVADFGVVTAVRRRLVVRAGIESGCCGEGTDTILLQVWCSAMH